MIACSCLDEPWEPPTLCITLSSLPATSRGGFSLCRSQAMLIDVVTAAVWTLTKDPHSFFLSQLRV